MPDNEDSPVPSLSPDSVDELFSRDPFGLSRQERDKIVANLWADRKRWEVAELSGKKTLPKAKKVTDVSDSDLGL